MGTNEWAFCPLKGLTVVRTFGNISTDDLCEWTIHFCMRGVTEFVLWDITRADISKLSAGEIWFDEQNTVDPTDLRNVRKAAIVSVNDPEFGLPKLLKTFCDVDDIPFEVQVFRSFDEAMNWLGVRPNPVTDSPNQPPAGYKMLHRGPGHAEDPSHIGEVNALR